MRTRGCPHQPQRRPTGELIAPPRAGPPPLGQVLARHMKRAYPAAEAASQHAGRPAYPARAPSSPVAVALPLWTSCERPHRTRRTAPSVTEQPPRRSSPDCWNRPNGATRRQRRNTRAAQTQVSARRSRATCSSPPAGEPLRHRCVTSGIAGPPPSAIHLRIAKGCCRRIVHPFTALIACCPPRCPRIRQIGLIQPLERSYCPAAQLESSGVRPTTRTTNVEGG